MKYYSYENFKVDVNMLLPSLKAIDIDVVVGIARGGLTLAHALSEGLNIRDVQSIRTELYDKTCKREEINIFEMCNLENAKRVLVVDDISDTGETLNAVMGLLKKKYEDIDFKTLTLFYKKTSLCEPDYWLKEADEWIEFFWEKDFSK